MHAIWRDKGMFKTEAYGPTKSDKKESMVNEIGTLRNTEKNRRRTTW